MIVCAKPTIHDLSVIVHEMGHLHYFMAFKDQPVIYQVIHDLMSFRRRFICECFLLPRMEMLHFKRA